MDQIDSVGRLQGLAGGAMGAAALIVAAFILHVSPELQTLMGSGDSGRLMSFTVVTATVSSGFAFGWWFIHFVGDVGYSLAEWLGLY